MPMRLIALLLLLLAAPAAAQVLEHPEPSATVRGATGVTYLDLMREIVPDLDGSGYDFEGTTVVPMRHIAGEDSRMDAPERPRLQGPLAAIALSEGRHLLLFDLGNPDGEAAGFVVLAVYDLARQPRLIDAVNVGFDQFSMFVAPAVRPLGGGELVVTRSEHSNSSQTYTATALTLLRDNRFTLIDDVYTFGDAHCTFERPQQLTLSVAGETGGMADIVATVAEYVIPAAEACGDEKPPQASVRTVAVTYRWDVAAGRYAPDSDAFDRLADENQERF
jgi:hypothetical protein